MAQKTRSKRDPDEEVTKHERELAEYLQERIKPGLNRGAIPLLARSIAKEIVKREHRDGEAEDAAADEEPAAEADEQPEAEARDDAEATTDESDREDDAEADDNEDEDADMTDAEADEGYEDEDDRDAEAEAESEDDFEDEDEDERDADDAEEDEESSDEGDGPVDFEAEMHELQAELGEEWILRFSVQGDDAWLTAEKKDGSQHVEAPTAEVLLEAVELLEDGGGRSS